MGRVVVVVVLVLSGTRGSVVVPVAGTDAVVSSMELLMMDVVVISGVEVPSGMAADAVVSVCTVLSAVTVVVCVVSVVAVVQLCVVLAVLSVEVLCVGCVVVAAVISVDEVTVVVTVVVVVATGGCVCGLGRRWIPI